jgi:hypothetical protein
MGAACTAGEATGVNRSVFRATANPKHQKEKREYSERCRKNYQNIHFLSKLHLSFFCG